MINSQNGCSICYLGTTAQVYSLKYMNGTSPVSPFFTIPSTNSTNPSGAITINDGGTGISGTTYPI